MMTDMLAVGEETGDLPSSLSHIAKRYENELDHSLKIFTTALEPILIVLISVVVGFVSVLALMLAYLHGLDRKLYVLGAAGIVFALLSVGVRYYATEVEPYALEIREVVIRSDKISQPVRILHVTDIQSAAIGAYEKRVFHVIRQLDPDLILNTGDNLQPIAPATLDTEMPKLWALFDTLTPLLGKYCIYGNVWDRDLYPRDPRLGGQTLLDNTSVVIPTPGGTLHVLGLGLQASRHPGPVIQDWFAALPEPACRLLQPQRSCWKSPSWDGKSTSSK